jgi:hypothetical protein
MPDAQLPSPQYLSIYLNDHLAGATVGVELAKRLHASNEEDEALAAPLLQISSEIDADRKTLEQVLERLDVSRSPVKPIAAWLLERLGRLKPNGQLRGYSPLSRVLELEGLAMGVTGKIELWRSLAKLDLGERVGVDFAAMTERAQRQLTAIGELHQLAVGALGQRPIEASP